MDVLEFVFVYALQTINYSKDVNVFDNISVNWIDLNWT